MYAKISGVPVLKNVDTFDDLDTHYNLDTDNLLEAEINHRSDILVQFWKQMPVKGKAKFNLERYYNRMYCVFGSYIPKRRHNFQAPPPRYNLRFEKPQLHFDSAPHYLLKSVAYDIVDFYAEDDINKDKRKCGYCGIRGHTAKKCPKKHTIQCKCNEYPHTPQCPHWSPSCPKQEAVYYIPTIYPKEICDVV
jgi:hypothetical protein